MGDDVEQRYQLIRSVGEECVLESELRNLVAKKPGFRLYDGFEPSGRMHIAQGLFKARNVNKCTRAGGEFTFWVADWFALMNDKMGGDLEKIKDVGQYFVEVWKAAGMDMKHVTFRWCSEEIVKNADTYWPRCLDVARVFSVARVKKCCTIMGRKENSLTAAQILYPTMQCTDVFFLKADICQLGVDQRKVNMLAREYCDAVGIKLKPVILSHHMLYGLKKGQAKMSKSDPDSAIFMEDDAANVIRKMNQAYCPLVPEKDENAPVQTEDEKIRLVEDELMNPCLDYVKNIIFSAPDESLTAGGVTYTSYEAVKDALLGGQLAPDDLKVALGTKVDELLEPVRQHFQNDPEAKALLERIRTYKKETLVLTRPDDKSLRRLKATDGSKSVYAVFAPAATGEWKIATVLSVLQRLQAAPEGQECVLWLPDWGCIALNCFNGEHKSIKAAYTLLVGALTALKPELMARVNVMYQSTAILSDPSDYWISVINVGRAYQLQRIMDAYGDENLTAGQVVAALMHVGDVLALAPTAIGSCDSDRAFHDLAIDYYGQVGIKSLPLPQVHVSSDIDLRLKSLDADAHMGPEELLLLDATHDLSSKLKKAFCEPQNTTFCPPLTLAKEMAIPLSGAIVIKRKPENGGDKTYSSVEELYADFASMSLHPGDLKPAVKDAVEHALAPVHEHFKNDAECKKAAADVKAALKKMSKKK